jgi:hypothetical protein
VLRRLQGAQSLDSVAVRAAQQWLREHPEETAWEVSSSGLDKFDGPIAEVLGQFDAAVAVSCVPALVSLLQDLNWPAYLPARDALFGFDPDTLLAGLEVALSRGEFEGFDEFCYEARLLRPTWVDRLRPLAEKTLHSQKDSRINLPHTTHLVETI